MAAAMVPGSRRADPIRPLFLQREGFGPPRPAATQRPVGRRIALHDRRLEPAGAGPGYQTQRIIGTATIRIRICSGKPTIA